MDLMGTLHGSKHGCNKGRYGFNGISQGSMCFTGNFHIFCTNPEFKGKTYLNKALVTLALAIMEIFIYLVQTLNLKVQLAWTKHLSL